MPPQTAASPRPQRAAAKRAAPVVAASSSTKSRRQQAAAAAATTLEELVSPPPAAPPAAVAPPAEAPVAAATSPNALAPPPAQAEPPEFGAAAAPAPAPPQPRVAPHTGPAADNFNHHVLGERANERAFGQRLAQVLHLQIHGLGCGRGRKPALQRDFAAMLQGYGQNRFFPLRVGLALREPLLLEAKQFQHLLFVAKRAHCSKQKSC